MSRTKINYLDRKDRIIGFYLLYGEHNPNRIPRWTSLLQDASLEADASSYPGAPVGWAKIEVVATEPIPRAYVICKKCRGVAAMHYTVDEYFALDCLACGRHLQNITDAEMSGEPAPNTDARALGDETK